MYRKLDQSLFRIGYWYQQVFVAQYRLLEYRLKFNISETLV